jgi:CubicO group peptidase (beta-lactamase class C family)
MLVAVIGVAVLGIGAGSLALRARPIWALRGMFSDERRAESFRSLHETLPSWTVRPGDDPWPFLVDERPLPSAYAFEGEERSLASFLDESETTGLLVARDGVILHESYARGNDAASLATSFSVAKSVTSALVGIAVERGLVASLDDDISAYVPELAAGGFAAASIRHLLTMTSGVAWTEDYDDPRSDVMRLPLELFLLGRPLPCVLASLGSDHDPGRVRRYVSSDALALGLLLERVTGLHPAAFLEEALWVPAGMASSAAWGSDLHGHALTHAFLGATLRDYARFGRLYLEGGRRDGVQVVPEGWVEASFSPVAVPSRDAVAFGADLDYGYQWWIPPDGADEAYAMGIYGQHLYLHRGLGVVIAKTSTDPHYLQRQRETLAVFRAIARDVGR